LLAGTKKLQEGNFQVLFENGKKKIEYKLSYKNSVIAEEEFKENNIVLMKRGKGGKGKLIANKVGKGKMIDFQAPENELAVVFRRDSIQHPYFESLHQWGKSVIHFPFGTPLGRDHLAIFKDEKEKKEEEIGWDTNKVAQVFKKGVKNYGDAYTRAVIKDMKKIGYDLEKIELKTPDYVEIQGVIPSGQLFALYVKEKGIASLINQHSMSQGMFRVLSVVIQINYAQKTNATECVLIDDIGEGLDFERSCSLINLLIDKVKNSSIQLVMTTNDRFVMNAVPLEYWSILDRKDGKCHVFNNKNSKDIFDEFKFTGLNNFDLLTTNFIKEIKK
jgi:hypothetical protein